MSQRTMDKLETVGCYYLFLGMPVLSLVCMASVVVGLSLLGFGLVASVLYVLADS